MAKKLSQAEWIEECQRIHKNKYDYSKVEYINKRSYVIIICPIHGEFKQLAHNHKRGQGCPLCASLEKKKQSQGHYGGVISLSNQRFNNEYDFPHIKEEYVNSHSIITIRHKICGCEFKKIANDHLTSKHGGCPCLRKYEKSKMTIEEKIDKFLKKTKELFHDEYVYPNIENEYKDYQSILTIIHKKCGNQFKMKVKVHLDSKNGRCECYRKEKQINSKERFIESFNKINEKNDNQFICHENEYVNQNTPITFTCQHCHNIFKRKPTVFIYMNHTCPYCNNKNRNRTYTTEEFIKKANEIHQNKYDYSQTSYINTDSKVCVICHQKDEFGEEHGVFYVTPHSHIGLMKSGCPKCSQKYGSQERFIKLANKTFNNFYDYSLVKYKNALTKVQIRCPIHGSFEITPNDHLMGRGCPHCQESKLENIIRTLLMDNQIHFVFQQKFEWLGKLSLDFYLPEYNVAIECQGEQHFKPIEFFGGQEKFAKTIKNDKMKKQLCEKHNVKLLYFSNLNIEFPYDVITEQKQLISQIIC